MEIKNIGSNQTEVTINGMIILYSYSTPVAAYITWASGYPEGFYKTNQKHSKTISKHINQWYSGEYQEKDQFWFDMLVQGI